MRLLGKVGNLLDHAIDYLAVAGAVLIVFIMFTVVTEVIMRYWFDRPLSAVIEIVEYALLFITFFGAAWVLRREGHVKMDLLLIRLRPGPQAVLNVVTSVLSAIICLVLVWYGIKVTLEHFQTGYIFSTPLRPPSFPIIAVVPLGSLMLFIQFLRRSYNFLGGQKLQINRD